MPRLTGQYALLAALLALLSLTLLYPIFLTVKGAFATDVVSGEGFTTVHVRMVFEDPVLVSGLLNSFKIATGTTTLAVLIALPLAVVAARYRFPLRVLCAGAGAADPASVRQGGRGSV